MKKTTIYFLLAFLLNNFSKYKLGRIILIDLKLFQKGDSLILGYKQNKSNDTLNLLKKA
jgi:hypothetical protein